MADLVETVARAMWDARHPQGYWSHATDTQHDLFGIEARAAIAAVLDDMAEPSVAVCLAGSYAAVGANPGIDAWQAMLAQYRKEMLG